MIHIGKRVKVIGFRHTGRVGVVLRLNRCSVDTARLWYVRLDATKRAKECVDLLWESELAEVKEERVA
mgnify:CR=1 FL=1